MLLGSSSSSTVVAGVLTDGKTTSSMAQTSVSAMSFHLVKIHEVYGLIILVDLQHLSFYMRCVFISNTTRVASIKTPKGWGRGGQGCPSVCLQ